LLKKITLVIFAVGVLAMGMGIAVKKTTSATIPYVQPKQEFLEPNPEQVDVLYQEWLKEQEIKKRKQVGKFDPCSCVSYARWKSGINVGPIGKAKNHPIDSDTPTVGGLVITNESGAGHLAVIKQVWAETIVVDESNYVPCKVSSREIRRDSPSIIGYYY
jgi:hypothetical protein